ncbi:MAG: fucose pyrophosphorylase domain-containing protein [Candidatus Zipacnadales bacterium]
MSRTSASPKSLLKLSPNGGLARLTEIIAQARARVLQLPSRPVWDYLLVTASTSRQAALYRHELLDRQARCWIDPRTRILVIPDPPEGRIGSGGGVLWALRVLARTLRRSESTPEHAVDIIRVLQRGRTLVINSGGDSRRVPLFSATGKLFAPLPAIMPDGAVSTVFDELWAALYGLGENLEAGVVVASGDVLLAFDLAAVAWPQEEVIGLACSADPQTASHHGVYLLEEGGAIRGFLQKPTLKILYEAGAVKRSNRVAVDSGVIVFQKRATRVLTCLAVGKEHTPCDLLRQVHLTRVPLDLYTHFIYALISLPSLGGNELANGPDMAYIRELRQAFSGIGFRAVYPEPSAFIHLGKTALYRYHLTRDKLTRRCFQFGRCIGAQTRCAQGPLSSTVVRSLMEGRDIRIGRQAIVLDTESRGHFHVGPGAIVDGVHLPGANLVVKKDVVLKVLPVCLKGPANSPIRGLVAILYGIADDTDIPIHSSKCTWLGRPLGLWLRRLRISQAAVWGDIPAGQRTLWNARLFPVAVGSDDTEVLQLIMWVQEAPPVSRRDREKWYGAQRVSFAELSHILDPTRTRQRGLSLSARIVVQRAIHNIETGGDDPIASELQALSDGVRAATIRRLTSYAMRTRNPLHRGRILKALADTATYATVIGRQSKFPRQTQRALGRVAGIGSESSFTHAARKLEARALATTAEALLGKAPLRECQPYALTYNQMVVATAPVRVDLAGGWTDTPPHCLEREGAVVNIAVNLGGKPPVCAMVRPLREHVVRLVSEDQQAQLETSHIGPLRRYRNPRDPLAILKGVLFCSGLLTERERPPLSQQLRNLGGGIEIRTHCRVPQGSGLGTSSILGGVVLAALRVLCGEPPEVCEIVDDVLRLEQMLTTGGGWQDQVGGLIGGIKLTTSKAGLPPLLRIRQLATVKREALEERLLLGYTGKTRLARNILQRIMGRYIARDPTIIHALRMARELAQEIAIALEVNDFDKVGHLMTRQWECNKRLEPSSTNSHVEALFAALDSYAVRAKLTGAGGGGFLIVMLPDASFPSAKPRLEYSCGVHFSPLQINDHGLKVEIRDHV